MSALTRQRAALERRLIHRVTVQRNSETGLDARNNPLPPNWADHLTDEPCIAWQGRAGLVAKDDLQAFLHTWQVIAAHDADITELDRVSVVRDAEGNQTNSTPLRILAVQVRPTHRIITLEEAN